MTDHRDWETVATAIATQLGETASGPMRQIREIVRRYGVQRTQQWVADALRIEHTGGERTRQGGPRTRGGIFFAQVKRATRRRTTRRNLRPPPKLPTGLPPFVWEKRIGVVHTLSTEQGAIETVKLTLIGRPGKIIRFKGCVVTLMQPPTGPSLPRGLPALPPDTQPYVVYISRRQWQTVAEQLADPDRVLVIDGWVSHDRELAAIVVFALHVQVDLSQAAKNRQKGSNA